MANTTSYKIIEECMEKALEWVGMLRKMASLEEETLNLSLVEQPEITLDLDSPLTKDLLNPDLDSTPLTGNPSILDLAIAAAGLPWPDSKEDTLLTPWPDHKDETPPSLSLNLSAPMDDLNNNQEEGAAYDLILEASHSLLEDLEDPPSPQSPGVPQSPHRAPPGQRDPNPRPQITIPHPLGSSVKDSHRKEPPPACLAPHPSQTSKKHPPPPLRVSVRPPPKVYTLPNPRTASEERSTQATDIKELT